LSPRESEDILLNWLERLEAKLDTVIADRALDRVAVENRLATLESGRSVKQNVMLALTSVVTGVVAWLLNR
jgi:hypothetical protein